MKIKVKIILNHFEFNGSGHDTKLLYFVITNLSFIITLRKDDYSRIQRIYNTIFLLKVGIIDGWKNAFTIVQIYKNS